MIKPLIAIDIDEVLAATTEALRQFVNQQTGLALTPKHYEIVAPYWGYYETVWRGNGIEDMSLIHTYHQQMALDQADTNPVKQAVEAINELRKKYRLVALTSRESFMEEASVAWIERHFGDAFERVIFLGHSKSAAETKGEVCASLGASLLIDDNFEHCQSAIDAGLNPLVFGEYGWHLHDSDEIPGAHDWAGVRTFLDGSH